MEFSFFTSLLGVRCALCGSSALEPFHLCAACRWHFRHHSDELAKGTTAQKHVYGALAYEGWWRTVVLHQKGARTPLGVHLLGQELLKLAAKHFHAHYNAPTYAIVPVPGRMGELPHLVELLAQYMGHESNGALEYSPVLRHKLHYRLLQPQKNASRAARIGQAGRFKTTEGIRKSMFLPVILVDDVVSTGATLREATNTLVHAGAQVVGSVVLAVNHRT